MEELIIQLAQQHPAVAGLLALIGILRVINKPLFAFLRVLVEATPSTKDDELLVLVETSRAYKYFVFLVDWLTSAKIPPKVAVIKVTEDRDVA